MIPHNFKCYSARISGSSINSPPTMPTMPTMPTAIGVHHKYLSSSWVHRAELGLAGLGWGLMKLKQSVQQASWNPTQEYVFKWGIYRHGNMGDVISLLFESNEKHEGVPPKGQCARWKEKNRAKRTAAAAAGRPCQETGGKPCQMFLNAGQSVRPLEYQWDQSFSIFVTGSFSLLSLLLGGSYVMTKKKNSEFFQKGSARVQTWNLN